MIGFLKNLRTDAVKKKLLENVFSLSALQGTNYLLMLITLPYLTRVLGVEKFGLIMFAQAFVRYFLSVTDFGFNLSATRAISLAHDNKEKQSEIYSAVMLIKSLLTIICFALMLAIVFGFEKFSADWEVYFLTFGMVIGQVLFPIWYFQGIEKMKYQAIINFFAKLLFTVSIFIFISAPSDYLYVPLLNSLGFITGGVIAVFTVLFHFKVSLRIPSLTMLKQQIKEGWNIFISTISITLLASINTLILGIFTNNTIVGYYTGVEKIIQAIKFAPSPIYHAIYPHCAKLAETSKQQCVRFIRKVARYTFVIAAFVGLVMFLLAENIVVLILGSDYLPATSIFRIFSLLIFATPMAYIIFNVALLSFKLDKYFSRIYLTGALLNLCFITIFIVLLNWQANGAALSTVLAQVIITTIAYKTLVKHDIHILQNRDPQ